LPIELPPLPEETAGSVSPTLFPYPGTGLFCPPDCCDCSAVDCVETARRPLREAKRQARCLPGCHLWVSGEPLLWWVRPGTIPTLVRTGLDGSALIAGDMDYGVLAGGRLTAGMTNAADTLGITGGVFLLGRPAMHVSQTSTPAGNPTLVRPFVNAATGDPAAFPVAAPGALAGSVQVASSSQLWGAETNLVGNVIQRPLLGLHVLGGFRFLDLQEGLTVNQVSTLMNGGGLIAGNSALNDIFQTRNLFYGGQVGSQVELRWRKFTTNLVGKAALGSMHEVVDIRGDSTVGSGTNTTVSPAGLLAVSSNSGRQTRDEFTVVPEVCVNVGYQISSSLRVFAGYSFLYLGDVLRPGDQVNTTVNPGLVPASPWYGTSSVPAQPSALLSRSDFWAQGINFGLAFRY
jgi:hypothetical protein